MILKYDISHLDCTCDGKLDLRCVRTFLLPPQSSKTFSDVLMKVKKKHFNLIVVRHKIYYNVIQYLISYLKITVTENTINGYFLNLIIEKTAKKYVAVNASDPSEKVLIFLSHFRKDFANMPFYSFVF